MKQAHSILMQSLKNEQDMDPNGNNPQILIIYHRFLDFVQLIECLVRNALTIPSRLCNFVASSAILAAEDLKKHLSLEGLLCHGLSIVQKPYDLILKILEAKATKPVILGRPTPCSSTQASDFHLHASQSHNEDSSEERHYFPVNTAKQAECDSNFPGDERELSQVQNSVDDDVQSSSLSIIQEKDDKELEKDQKVTLPTVLPQKRAPKKTVSINENVEIYLFRGKRR